MKRVQKRTHETEKRILREAARLFQVNGYENTSIDAVAEQADVAKGTVFAHFGDKVNLLAAVNAIELDELVAITQAKAETGAKGTPVDDVLALYDPWLDFFARNDAFAKLFINQAGLSAGPWTERFIQACCTLEKAVEALIEDWRERRMPPSQKTATFLAEGAQAFFFNAVIYRLSGRTPDDQSQRSSLKAFLSAWFE